MKRIGTAVLCFVMLFALLAFPGFAADAEETATAASSEDILLRGYQNQLNTAGASAVSVRIIAEIGNVENYREVGFRITTAKKGEMNLPVTTVYSKLTAAKTDESGTAFEEEIMPKTAGNYLFALILTDINVSANAEMTVVPYAVGKDGVTVTGGTGNLQKPAGEASFTATYQVRFQTEDGTEISTVSVKRGENATFPTPGDSTYYYTASKAEYAKAFNVTANQTITLDTIASSGYSISNLWINNDADAAQATTKYNADFVTGNWNIASKPMQTAGAYFTISGNYANLELKFYVNQGDIAVYNLYVDDILVKVLTLDATDAAITTGTGWMVLDSGNMTAGMHTIKVEAVDTKSGQLMVLRPTKGPDIKDNYDVTFENADGSVFTTKTVANGATVTAPETNPIKTGFIFGEWQLNGATYNFSTPVTQDITLTPTWTFDAKNYSIVKFTVDGKTYGDEQYIEKGATATKPATDPAKENYAFKFWTADGKTAFDFATPITQNTEIRAYFEATATKHTVTYVDPTGAEIEKVTVVDGENAKLPTAPNGYWWKVNLSELVGITADKTVTLDKVLQSDYKALNNINNGDSGLMQIITNSTQAGKDSQTKYKMNLVKNDAGIAPGQHTSCTFLYQKGQSIEFTADFAGSLAVRMRCRVATSVTFAVYVDGYLIYDGTVNSTDNYNTSPLTFGTDIAAGEHTVRIVVTDMVGSANASSGFSIIGIYFQEPKTTETAE